MQAQLLDTLIPNLARHKAEQRKVYAFKQSVQKKMAGRLQTLQRWLQGGFVGFELIDEATRALSDSAQTWTVGEG